LERPHSGGHFAQLYQSDGELTENVGSYVAEGLRGGEAAVLIATPEHLELFSHRLGRLGFETPSLLASGRLIFCDAAGTLSRFMRRRWPDAHLFEATVKRVIGHRKGLQPGYGLRAYGEMVGILWKTRQFAAAARLEQLWNRLLGKSCFSLNCAYDIDVFGTDLPLASLDHVLCTHSHLIPAQSNRHLEVALRRPMDEILGPDSDAYRLLRGASYPSSGTVMPDSTATVLWLRNHMPANAREILQRSRYYYELQKLASAVGGNSTCL
jgi:hypothetical protein